MENIIKKCLLLLINNSIQVPKVLASRAYTNNKFKVYADKVHIPLVPLNVLTAPWPFAMWGMDMINEIRPTASNGHRFILVAIDYFTK